MTTFQDYMNRALTTNVPAPDTAPPMPSQYEMVAASPENKAASQLEADIRNLGPYDLRVKYGTAADQLIQGRNAALQQYQQDMSAGRTLGQGTYDIASDVGLGAANMLGGLGAFGLGIVNDDAGVWASGQMSDLNKFVQGTQSSGLNARRQALAAREKMNERENAALFEEDKEKDGETLAYLKQFGRDAIDAVSESAGDGMMLTSGISHGVGSLGPVGRTSSVALAAAKKLTPAGAKAAAARAASTGNYGDMAAALIAHHADNIATTGVIGAMGAGNAYQQTVNEVMEMKQEDLLKNSEPYRALIAQDVLPEDAKKQIAHDAGMRAAAISGPISLAAGALVAKFERNPFQAQNARTALGNIGRETIEEGVQSTGERLGLNAGVNAFADETRQLSTSLGTNFGQGALYGFGTASVVQAPTLASSAIGSGVNAAIGALGKSADRIQAGNEASAPNSMPNIQAEVNSALEAAPVAQETVQAGIAATDYPDEFKQRVSDYTTNMFSILQSKQEDQDNSTGPVRDVFASSPDRLTALDQLTDLITSTPDTDKRGQFDAAVALQTVLSDFRSHLESDLDVAEAIDSATPAGQVIERYSGILGKIETNAKVMAAVEMANRVIRKMAEERQPEVTATSHTTPEGRQAMQATAAIASVEPEKANLASVNMTLAHAQAGRIRLSAAQRQALMVTKGLLESAKQYDQTIQSSGQKPQDIVGTQIKSGTGHKLPSARDHVQAVSEAMRTGNRKVAAQALTEMGMFVQHMQNKVDALNQHFAGGTNDSKQSVSYQAVHPESREWYQSPKGMGVNVNSARSVAFAQQVGAEAEFMTNVFNSLVDAFPELQIPKMDQELLDAALVGNPHDVVAASQAGMLSRPGAAIQKAPPPAPPPAPAAAPPPAPAAAPTPAEFTNHSGGATGPGVTNESNVIGTQVADLARIWDTENRSSRSDAWFEGAHVDSATRTGFADALDSGGANLRAHGMAKESTLSGGVANLLSLLRNGLDSARGEGRLHYAPLVADRGGPRDGTTPSGSAYADGPFMLVARPGEEFTGNLAGVGAVLVNQSHASLVPALRQAIQAIRPDVMVEAYGQAGNVTRSLNGMAPTATQSTQATSVVEGDESLAEVEGAVPVQNQDGPLPLESDEEYAARKKSPAPTKSVEQPTQSSTDNTTAESEDRTSEDFDAEVITATQEEYDAAVQLNESSSEEDYEKTPSKLLQIAQALSEGRDVQIIEPEPVADDKVVNEVDDEATTSAAPTVFTSLKKWIKGGNRFIASFLIPKKQKSRLFGTETPFDLMRYALTDRDTVNEFIGEELPVDYSGVLAKEYESLLNIGDTIKEAMEKRLQAFLARSYSKTDPAPLGELMLNGKKPVQTYVSGKFLNITEVVTDANGNKTIQYNQELLESSILATLQWMLTGQSMTSTKDDEDIASILQVTNTAAIISGDSSMFNRGLQSAEIVSSLGSKVFDYWGVSKASNGESGFTEGIPMGVAAEILDTLLDLNMLTEVKEKFTLMDGDQEITREFNFYTVNENDDDTIYKLPNMLDEMVLLDNRYQIYMDGKVPPVSDAQLRNPVVKNTPEQKATLAKVNNITFKLNKQNIALYDALGEAALVELSGATILEDVPYHVKDKKSLLGRMQGITGAFHELQRVISQAELYGLDTDIRYSNDFTKVARLQMMGRYTPVSSKLMREALLPTNSTIDVSIPGSEGHSAFYLALAQALGEKVHTQPHSVSFDNVQKQLNTKFARAIDMLQNWHAEGQQDLPASGVQILKEAFGKDFSFVGLHALTDYARYLNMSESERETFNTSMYVEADGVTNGPINAIALSTTGLFTERELDLLAKGGLWFNEPDQTMNTYRMQDKVDLYMDGAQNTKMEIKDLFASLRSGSQKGREADTLSVGNDIMFLLNHFLEGVTIKQVSPGNTELEVQRNATKNPLTVTVYGSGTTGITNKVVGLLMDAIYERMTLAAQSSDLVTGERTEESMARAIFPDAGDPVETYRQFMAALSNVTRRKVVTYKDKKTGQYVSAAMQEYPRGKIPNTERVSLGPGPVITGINPETFTLTYPAMMLLTANVQKHFTAPMRDGIKGTLGPTLLENMKTVRFAVQVMSVYASAAFDRGYVDLVEKKKKADPNYQPHFGITQAEADQLMQQYRFAMPLINTGPQEYYITGKDRTTVSRSMATSGSGKFSVPGTIMAPSNAGVKASASLNIGLGDAFAMQRTILGILGDIAGLPVFDGFNMALDKLQDYSDKANMGVLQSWEQNPFKPVLETYRQFMEVAPVPDDAIIEKFFEGSGQTFDLEEVMKMTLEKLTKASANADTRIAVRRLVAKTVDQMASVGKAHVTQGIELTGTNEEKADQLNKLFFAEEAKTRVPLKAAMNFGRTLKSGVSQLLMRSFKKEHRADKYPWDAQHKEVMDALIDSGNLDGYQVISGTKEQILQYIKDNRKQAPEGVDLDNAFGWMNPVDKVVYFVSGSESETLVHELVHASTIETLISHYSGKLTGDQAKTVKMAVDNIEQMMAQFLNMEDSFINLSYQSQTAYENAVAAIKGYLGNSDMDPALAKASALNEFMAWTLANKKLASVAKNVKANPIVAFTKKALELIKTLIFGGKGMPKVGDDLYSNLLFNTSILSRVSPSADSMMFGSLSHNVPPSMDERLTAVREAFNAQIGQWLNTDFVTQGFRKTEVTDAIASAMTTVQTVIAHGFSMSSSEQATMQAVVAALATGAKLNSTALIRAQELFDHVTKTLKPEHFLDDSNTTNPNDLNIANEKFNVIMGNYTAATDKYGRTGLLPTFLGLAIVNSDMRNALSRLPVPAKEKAKFTSMDEGLQSAGNVVMEKLIDSLSGKTGNNANVQSAVDTLTNHIMATMVEEHTLADLTANKVNGLLGSANEYVQEGLEFLAAKAIDKASELEKQSSSRIKRLAITALKASAAIASEKEGAVVAEGVIAVTNQLKGSKTYAAMVAELIGRTLSNTALYDMIKVFRMRNQQTRQKYREDVPRIISEKFTRKLTDHEWGAMFRGMAKTDLAALRQTMSIAEILALVKDKKVLETKINDLESSIKKGNPHWALHQKKMKQLATHMTTGVAGNNLLRNAYTVSRLFNEGKLSPKVDAAFEANVDQLISLYAFQAIPQSDRNALSSLVQSEGDGLSFSMSYLEGQRKDEQARITGAAVTNHFKGYTPSLQQEGVTLRVAEDGEHATLMSRSYMRVGTYKGSSIDRFGSNRGYYFAPVNSKSAFNQGLMQTVHQTAYGVSATTGMSSGVLTAGAITKESEVKALAFRMRLEKPSNEALMPVLDESGEVIAFERSVDPAMLSHLNRDQHFGRMVGVWRGRQVEEYEGQILNNELVKKAHEMWASEKRVRGTEYVNLLDPNLEDPVLRDAVKLITFETRKTIEGLFGKDTFMVRADLIDNVIGYRMPSVADAWTGDTRWGAEVQDTTRKVLMGFMGNKAYKYMVNGEKDIQDLVQQSKLMIVIKSVIVGGANIASNILQLASLNIPLNRIVRDVPKKLAEVHFYQEKQIRRIEAEAELRAAINDPRAARRLTNEIQAIDDSIKRLNIWPLLEAGEFSSIADAGISRDDLKLTTGRIAEFVEGIVDKLPPKVQTAGKYALITRDTAIFQGLQKMVQYGDFVAKAIMYDDLVDRQKMDVTDAKGRVSEEFVNYEWLPGRFRSYVEAMGMIWFWHFKVRSVKVAINLMRRNPVSSMLSLLVPNMLGANIGSPITDNLFSVAADGRLPYSLGPGQGLSSPNLHPFF